MNFSSREDIIYFKIQFLNLEVYCILRCFTGSFRVFSHLGIMDKSLLPALYLGVTKRAFRDS